MDRQPLHYHIRWAAIATLDWECFSTRAAAEAGAERLLRSGETYIIEEHDQSCPRPLHAAGRGSISAPIRRW
jgi:hypothetical protein